MARDGDRYVALICSLPVCGHLFEATNTPISRYQLQQRLRELTPEDHRDLHWLSEVVDWFEQPRDRTDAQLVALFRRHLDDIQNPDLRAMLVWRMEFRTVIAALRRRHAGEALPSGVWGYGRWLPLIARHWSEPTLGLDKRLPWVAQAVDDLRNDRALALEKLLLNEVWQWLERLSWYHEFDLAAVAIYRMRWDLISRWVRYQPEPARARFSDLVEAVAATVQTPQHAAPTTANRE